MLHRDYILDLVEHFVTGITDAFRRAVGGEPLALADA